VLTCRDLLPHNLVKDRTDASATPRAAVRVGSIAGSEPHFNWWATVADRNRKICGPYRTLPRSEATAVCTRRAPSSPPEAFTVSQPLSALGARNGPSAGRPEQRRQGASSDARRAAPVCLKLSNFDRQRSINSPSSIARISLSQPACSAILLSAMTSARFRASARRSKRTTGRR
jgi:hypothetical protein